MWKRLIVGRTRIAVCCVFLQLCPISCRPDSSLCRWVSWRNFWG